MCSSAVTPCLGILGEGIQHLYSTLIGAEGRTQGVFSLTGLRQLPPGFLGAIGYNDLEAAAHGMTSCETVEEINQQLVGLGMYTADLDTVNCIRSTLCCKLRGACRCRSHNQDGLCPACAFVSSDSGFEGCAQRQARMQLRAESEMSRRDVTTPFLPGVRSGFMPAPMVKERDRRVALKPARKRVKASSSSRPTAAAAKQYLKGLPPEKVARLIASACPGQAETQTAARVIKVLCSSEVGADTKDLLHQMAQNLSRKPKGRRYGQKTRSMGINLMNAGGPQALRVLQGIGLVASQRRVRAHRNKAKVGYRYGGQPGEPAFDNQLQRAGEILRQGSDQASPVLVCSASDGSAVTMTLEATYQAAVPADKIPERIIIHGFTGDPLVLEGPTIRDIPQAMESVSRLANRSIAIATPPLQCSPAFWYATLPKQIYTPE